MMKMSLPCVAIIAAALAGCTGTMQGAIRGEGTPVVFTYQQGFDSDTYTAMIGGEWFSGRAVRADASRTSAVMFGAVSARGVATTTTGRFKATLLGNHGSTLRCLMQYADTDGFTSLGGIGECHHSDGRVIDVSW